MQSWSGPPVLVFFMTLVLSGPNAFSQSNSIDREHDAIIISGEMLAPFAGATISDLFLYAFDNQSRTFTQIPFQFDERGVSGTDTSFLSQMTVFWMTMMNWRLWPPILEIGIRPTRL